LHFFIEPALLYPLKGNDYFPEGYCQIPTDHQRQNNAYTNKNKRIDKYRCAKLVHNPSRIAWVGSYIIKRVQDGKEGKQVAGKK
jgi:hypothetical protein